MIPIESEASFKKGSWFIHNDGINTIQIWSSNLNGKEKVFLNNELVSEQRSLKMQNSHKFKDKNGHNYEVEFKVINLFKGVLNCSIKKDGLVIKVFKTRFVIGLKNILKYLLILFLASFIFSILMIIFNLPVFTLFIFTFLVLIFYLKFMGIGEIIIEKE